MVFPRSLSDTKSLQVSWTNLSILDDLNNASVWIVSIRLPISNSTSLLTKLQGTIPSAPITVGITVTLTFHSFFFSSLAKFKNIVLSFCFLFFYSVVWRQNPLFDWFSFLCLLLQSLLLGIRWSVLTSKSQILQCVLFYRTDSGLCIYHLVVWSNFNFLHNSRWITFLTQLCLVLYSLCSHYAKWDVDQQKSTRARASAFARPLSLSKPNIKRPHVMILYQDLSGGEAETNNLYSLCYSLLHSLIMRWMVSSLSLHYIHLLFCFV